MSRYLLPAAGLLACATAALANDSTASTGAGGLVLRRTADIDMVSEDLFVSVEQVRVHYVFRNRSPRDANVTVAFPMPDRNLAAMGESDIGYPSDFHTEVAGRPVNATLERHVFGNDHDQTALLQSLHIPLAPNADGINHIIAALDALPAARRDELHRLGLVDVEEYDQGRGMERHWRPTWMLRDTWYWQQTFPAGRDLVVDHRYRPGAGSSAGTPLAFRDYRNSADGRAEAALYCADADFIASLDRLTRAGGEGTELPDYRVDYILTTGGNWRSPIGDFRLVVDKGSPRNLLSFCETGVRRLSPTQFEVRHHNWRPTRDLHILIVQPDQ
ncbi:MAG: DUF4424 domain-containing protein [Sphingomonadaceae bacterium]|nr:DUF4424 domain-containing protein [Sphingomonadaceae bacterium]